MKKGFTLVEMLVTIMIVGILAAIAIPALTDAAEKRQSNQSNIKTPNGWITVEYDHHKFISVYGRGILHHPDCKCDRVER